MPRTKKVTRADMADVTQAHDCAQKPARQKKGQVLEPVSVAELRVLDATNREEFSKSKHTISQYNRYIKQGKEFLSECVKQRRASGGAKIDGIDDELLEKAFDNPPNKMSAEALDLFLVQKCLREECRESTAATVQAAFAWYWDNMDGERYAGKQYFYDEEKDEVNGCPARAPAIRSLIKVIKAKCGADGISRRTAEPMTVEDLTHIIRWSEKKCPPVSLDQLAANAEEEFSTAKHAMVRAYMTAGFTLWTRNFELCKLEAGHVSEDRYKAPYDSPYFTVSLVNRKGWLRSANGQHINDADGALENRTYKIFKQPVHEIDMYVHMRRWQKYLEACLGRPLLATDNLFPHISTNGLIHPDRHMSHTRSQDLISEFASGAGLTKHFSTHCFRRGGAQYRFMYAPVGQRWSLNMIRWWGAWAGEQVGVLERYLINTLQGCENNFSDALDPNRNDTSRSFMGEHELMKPATVHEVRSLATSIVDAIKTCGTNAHISPWPAVPTSDVRLMPSDDVAMVPLNLSASAAGENVLPAASSNPVSASTVTGAPSQLPAPQEASLSARRQPAPYIPDLRPREWKRAIAQWHDGEPTLGLHALKLWDPELYRGRRKNQVATKRQSRQLIAEEYEFYGCNDEAFLGAYPEANRSIAALCAKIRKERKERLRCHTRQHGTPLEQDSRECSVERSRLD